MSRVRKEQVSYVTRWYISGRVTLTTVPRHMADMKPLLRSDSLPPDKVLEKVDVLVTGDGVVVLAVWASEKYTRLEIPGEVRLDRRVVNRIDRVQILPH